MKPYTDIYEATIEYECNGKSVRASGTINLSAIEKLIRDNNVGLSEDKILIKISGVVKSIKKALIKGLYKKYETAINNLIPYLNEKGEVIID